ncbi:hypothetical protein DPEC_G00261390 [Dallia pectoralis]|uniref:Uncharacterized protein n=1 Tax=Dallia pectoralis TaxID=75939 RepID=A0ACC2FR93_DALPE|nr:hypothetical protein DPEC_G00261390 [Dallia pectoralis]
MLDTVFVCGAPPVTSYFWLLILSWSIHGQPELSELVFSTRPEDGVGLLGAPLSLHCAVYNTSSQRALSVKWGRANGEPAALGPGPDNEIHQLANGSLFFPKLRERDLGSYVCYGGSRDKNIKTVVQVMIAVDLDRVFFSPPSQTVSEGQSVFLQCVSGDSSPPADITWLKDSMPFTKGTQIQGQYGGGNQRKTSGTLHLWNISREDQGEYICVTHNPLLNTSQESIAATLTIQEFPTRLQITQGPHNITVVIETEASMCCAVRGFPAATVQWFKDSRLLKNSSGIILQNKGELLVFRNVSEEDYGSYYCEARNDREMVRSQTAFLFPAVLPTLVIGRSFVQQPSNRTVKKGDSVTLVCRPPNSNGPTTVHWFKNNRPLTPRTHFTVRRNGDLAFHSVHDTDSGVYFCRASNVNINRFVTSRTARLTVLEPPSVRLWPLVVTVPVGAMVVFQCQVWGHPRPSITWSKQGRSTQTGGKIVVGVRNATLSILSVRSYDEGSYTCEASNTVGRDQRTATLRVAVSPIIMSFTGAVRTSEGSSVVLPCRAVGEVPIWYTWTSGHSQASIIRTLKRHVDDDGALHISNIEVSDAGDYHCTAENRAGRQQRTASLTISDKDDKADRNKQQRQMIYSATNNKAEQGTPLHGVQRFETTQSNVPLEGKSPARASPRNLSNDISQASTLETLRLPGSLGGQTGRLVPPDLHLYLQLDQDSNPTQRTDTQTQTPVLRHPPPPPPPPLYQPLELLRRLHLIHTKTTLAYSLPPVPRQGSLTYRHVPNTTTPEQQNVSYLAHPAETSRANDTEPTEWLKRNTSQSPMRTSEDSRAKPLSPWLPVLEKHDIPIVVGVGVSLAFIFITMAFYSLVQKNETTPAVRALSSVVPRNVGVPCRNAERLAAGRTYDNRAFEEDDLQAVIEQSPNTSDTRAVPPAPGIVAVMIDAASDETQAETGPTSEHSVIAETYPEPCEETLVDHFLDEEKDCSLSHPSIQLQCVEDWSCGGVEHGHHQSRDVLSEPPCLSPSPSGSLSSPPGRDESLRSTLTLQTAESCVTPIHHSVSVSHGNTPLLLSHCVSLGHTTVAVDVHFYPAVPASGATAATVAAATQINANVAAGRGPRLSSRLAHLQEHDQSAFGPHHC